MLRQLDRRVDRGCFTSQSAKATLRPRFNDGLEGFVTEASVYLRLPETGASVRNMQEQHDKVQQSFLRMPSPEGAVEKNAYEQAKTFTSESAYLIEYFRLYAGSKGLPNASEVGKRIDELLEEFRLKLKPMESALDH